MPEPTSTAAATISASGLSIPTIIIFGIPLGLRPDILIAGFFGSIVAIILLNSVPSGGDTRDELLRTTFKRMGVAIASSLTAGYLTPLAPLIIAAMPDPLLSGIAFAVGAGAQKVLVSAIARISGGNQR